MQMHIFYTCIHVQFKGEHKLKGTLVNVAKVKTKDQLIKDYKEFFETKVIVVIYNIFYGHSFFHFLQWKSCLQEHWKYF